MSNKDKDVTQKVRRILLDGLSRGSLGFQQLLVASIAVRPLRQAVRYSSIDEPHCLALSELIQQHRNLRQWYTTANDQPERSKLSKAV